MRRYGDVRNKHSNQEIRTWEYRKWRKKQLDRNPLCVACLGHGLDVPATEMDHIRTREELKEDKRRYYRETRGKTVHVDLPGLMNEKNVAGLCFLHNTMRSLCQARGGGPCTWDRDTGKPVMWWMFRITEHEWDLTVPLPSRYAEHGW